MAALCAVLPDVLATPSAIARAAGLTRAGAEHISAILYERDAGRQAAQRNVRFEDDLVGVAATKVSASKSRSTAKTASIGDPGGKPH